MKRWSPLVLVVASLACVAGDDGPSEGATTSGPARGSSSGGAEDAGDVDGSTAASGTMSLDATGEPGGTDAGSSGEAGVECRQGSAGVGAIGGISLPGTWAFEEERGVSEGDCTAVAYDGERLELECTRDGEGAEVHAISILGGGPVVGDALQAIVGMEGLRLFLPYGLGFFPDAYLTPHFSVRSQAGELLVLWSYDGAGPGDPFAETSVDAWADPFVDWSLVDEGCARIENPQPETAPADWKPFALEVGTDDGPVALYEGEQETLTVGGAAWEVSVTRARADIPCPADCPTDEIELSIVRHP